MKRDQEIQKDVMEELKWVPFLNSSEIGVAVKDGVVTLSGTVDTYGRKTAAEDVVKKVAGVKAIAEDLTVEIDPLRKKSDAEIAEAVVVALQWHIAVPHERVKVLVEDGWVTLSGEVDWEFQKVAARNAVMNLSSVKGITNSIVVKDTAMAKDVQQKIAAAFHRNATIDAAKVHVEIHGKKAVLTGTVRSWAERDEAEKAAWNAQGINAVDNRLTIA